jgi:hypothetical protein
LTTICDRDYDLRLAIYNINHGIHQEIATMDHDTDLTDCHMKNTFVQAFSKLNKQRIHLSNMAAEGQESEDLGPTHNTHEAQEALDALQKVLRMTIKRSRGYADTCCRGCAFSLL